MKNVGAPVVGLGTMMSERGRLPTARAGRKNGVPCVLTSGPNGERRSKPGMSSSKPACVTNGPPAVVTANLSVGAWGMIGTSGKNGVVTLGSNVGNCLKGAVTGSRGA